MKKTLLLLPGLLVLAGCHIETGTPKVSTTTPPVNTTNDTPPKPATGTEKDPIPENKENLVSHVKHKDRIYQLADLKVEKLVAGGHTIDAWVMDSTGRRTEGMMFLKDEDVSPTQGMIFVFPKEEQNGFWMQNTFIPLDIIYIGKDKKVVTIAKGKPFDETNLPSKKPYQYVLELKQGQAEKFGITVGTLLQIPASVHTDE